MKAAALALLLALLLLSGCAEEKKEDAKPVVALGAELVPPKFMTELGVCLNYLDSFDKCVYNRATVFKMGQLCEAIKAQETRDNCFFEVGSVIGLKQVCLQAGTRKEDCLEKVALAKHSAEECLAIEGQERRNVCLKNLAVSSKEPAFCGKLEAEGKRDTCYAKIAVDSNNLDACRQIADGKVMADCLRVVGQETGTEEFCVEGTEEGDRCFGLAATRSGKRELCGPIVDSVLESICYAKVGQQNLDEDGCLLASGLQRDECLHAVGVALKDLRICREISTQETRSVCFAAAGQTNKNQLTLRRLAEFCAGLGEEKKTACRSAAESHAYALDYCDPVADANRLPCLRELNKFIVERALCDQFPAAEMEAKNGCIIQAAAEQGSVEACNELKEKPLNYACLKAVAINNQDERICETMELSGGGVTMRFDCLEEVAVAKGEASICMGIRFREQLGRCVGKIATTKKDPALCKEIRNDPLNEKDPFLGRDSCYLQVVQVIKDKEICKEVQAEALKEKCRELLG